MQIGSEKKGSVPELKVSPDSVVLLLSAGEVFQSQFMCEADYIRDCVSEAVADQSLWS